MNIQPNFFVFTGGPGVGKTTLLQHLQAMGELVVGESARAVIREQMADGGRGAPWLDPKLFCDLTVERDITAFDRMVGQSRRVFFDRGIIDNYGANSVPPSPRLVEAVRNRRYSPRVFIFPPWPEIYGTDPERRQSWPEAEATFGEILRRLPMLGYQPCIVPPADLATRAKFVLDRAIP